MKKLRRALSGAKAFDFLNGLLLTILSFVVVRLMTPYGAATSPDSVAYLDIAYQIASGNSWTATDFSLTNSLNQLTIENRIWPPLYPYILSLFVTNYDDALSASLSNAILLAITGAALYANLRQICAPLEALALSAATLLSPPVITCFTYAWSEAAFIPLLLMVSLFSIRYLSPQADKQPLRTLLFMALIAALILLSLTRYIGIFAIIILPLIHILTQRRASDRWTLMAGTIAYGLAVGTLLLTNQLETGSLSGGTRAASKTSFAENLQLALESISTFTTTPAPLAGLKLAIAISLAAAFFAIYRNSTPLGPSILCRNGATALATLSVGYIVALATLRARSNFDDIDIRLIAPAWPVLTLLLIFVAKQLPKKGPPAAILAILLLGAPYYFATQGISQILESTTNWADAGSPNLPMRGANIYNNFTRAPTQEHPLSKIIPSHAVLIVENRPIVWRFMTGRVTAELPKDRNSATGAYLRSLPTGSIMLLQKNTATSTLSALNFAPNELRAFDFGSMLAIRVPAH